MVQSDDLNNIQIEEVDTPAQSIFRQRLIQLRNMRILFTIEVWNMHAFLPDSLVSAA
jgi:hypothetical protein